LPDWRQPAFSRASAEVGAAQMILRTRVEEMRPLARLDAGDPLVDFSGTERVLNFYAAPPDHDGGRGLIKFRLLLTAPGDLVLYEVPELVADIDRFNASVKGWRGVTLLRNVSGLSIAYFGPIPEDKKRRWRQFWQETNTLPQAVRIRIAFRPGDRRAWPELIVRPAPTIDLSCDPEKGSFRCELPV
jgi:general secretion pathway protein J